MAAAVGVILFVLIFTATLVQRRLFGQAPHGEGRADDDQPAHGSRRSRRPTRVDAGTRRATGAARGAGGSPTSILIGYAILMFIPFAWSVITSFKTLPDSVQPERHPAAVHDRRLGVRADEAQPAVCRSCSPTARSSPWP